MAEDVHGYPEGFWKVGDRVKLSDYGLAANLGPKSRFNAKLRGTVVHVRVLSSGRVMGMRVLRDGYKHASGYYAGFWEHADGRVGRARIRAMHHAGLAPNCRLCAVRQSHQAETKTGAP